MGLVGTMISAISFGLSTSLLGMLISRGLGGALTGNVAVVSSMLSEMTDETNQAKGACGEAYIGEIPELSHTGVSISFTWCNVGYWMRDVSLFYNHNREYWAYD